MEGDGGWAHGRHGSRRERWLRRTCTPGTGCWNRYPCRRWKSEGDGHAVTAAQLSRWRDVARTCVGRAPQSAALAQGVRRASRLLSLSRWVVSHGSERLTCSRTSWLVPPPPPLSLLPRAGDTVGVAKVVSRTVGQRGREAWLNNANR